MTHVNTALGEGRIVESSSERGRTMHLVEGQGFSKWFTASDVFELDEVDQSKEDHVNEDNSTTLPYNPTPQHSDFTLPDESTLQPVYDIDPVRRTEDEDSLSVERISEKLGSKFIKLKESRVDRDTRLGRMISDPERYAREVQATFPPPTDDEMVKVSDLHYLIDSDPQIRQAAWVDVQKKATRLRSGGHVEVLEITPRAIHARVKGDHDTYETVVVRGGATIGSGQLTDWGCGCPWGFWAHKRRDKFAGRLCSHGFAAYVELQAKTRLEFNKDVEKNHQRNRPALLPFRNSNAEPGFGLLEGFFRWADDWANPIELEEYISEKDLSNREAEELDIRINKLFEYTEMSDDDVDDIVKHIDNEKPHNNPGGGIEVENYYPETHFVGEDDVEEDNRSYAEYDEEEDLYKVAASDEFTGFYSHVFTNGNGHEFGVIYNPLDQEVESFSPDNGIEFSRGEEEAALFDYISSLSEEEAFGKEYDLEEETPASRIANYRYAGRVFSLQEQMDLINEAPGDDEILGRLDLKGTHYEH